jgi:hypothetical protein
VFLHSRKGYKFLLLQHGLTLRRYRRLPEVDRSLVVLVDEDRPLGRGAFGHVFLGRLCNLDGTDFAEDIKLVKVAVKMAPGTLFTLNKVYGLSEDSNVDAQSSLLHEAEIMSRIGRCVFAYFRRV